MPYAKASGARKRHIQALAHVRLHVSPALYQAYACGVRAQTMFAVVAAWRVAYRKQNVRAAVCKHTNVEERDFEKDYKVVCYFLRVLKS